MGCGMHRIMTENNDMPGTVFGSHRSLLQTEEFPRGRYSIVDSEAYPTPTVPGNETSRQYGTGGIPFTTSGAYSELQDFSQAGDPVILQQEPTNLIPWSATGKLMLSSGTIRNAFTLYRYHLYSGRNDIRVRCCVQGNGAQQHS